MFLIALIFIILLVALPFIFKLIFKTKNFMGYSIGVICSVLTSVTTFIIIVVGIALEHVIFNRSLIGTIILGFIILISVYIDIFLFIFFFSKRISNENQPYNCVFMFIAGYLLAQFLLIYLYFIIIALCANEERELYIWPFDNYIEFEALIIYEVISFLYMIYFAGIIMLSMLHHRKVNKNIIIILLASYFLPFLLYIVGYIIQNPFLIDITMLVSIIVPLAFDIHFYHKNANQGTPTPEILESINSI